ncbi:MAG: SRPBCC family protein [Gemmatimonadetes bacterium]|nr:SRPBCC family protein [Gemmatimonadota bacterium]
MIRVSGSVVINRPLDTVFGFLSDFANAPKWQKGVVEVRGADGPTRLGTTIQETVRLLGRRIETECRVVAFEPPRRMAFEASAAAIGYRSEFELKPAAGGTLVEMRGEANLKGWWRLFELLAGAEARQEVHGELNRIKTVLEADGRTPSPAGMATLATLMMIGLCLPTLAHGQAMARNTSGDKEAKISNAMSAAPASLAARAAVMDWPVKDGEHPVQLRPGTNGYTCFPDMPATQGNDPMCIDQAWMSWMDAYIAHRAPNNGFGIGYMTAPGGAAGSNTDPYAEKPTAKNEWGFDGPHIMIVLPDARLLAGLPTKRPAGGGPWVMYGGTPYAHVMIPVSDAKQR